MQWIAGAQTNVYFNAESDYDFMIAAQGPSLNPTETWGAWRLTAPSSDYLGNFPSLDDAKAACDDWAAKLRAGA